MHESIDIQVEKNIFEENMKLAARNGELLKKNDVYSIDFLGSIGSGKTLIIENILDRLKAKGKTGAAIAGDVAGDDDFKRFKGHDVQAMSINTDKECHLDAHLISHALGDLHLDEVDVLFIENIGNLICPMDFPLGTDMRVVVISVTEGDDMVRKHPMIFGLADVIVINKIDLAAVMEVDTARIISDAKAINPHTKICLTDAKHGDGIDQLISALGI